jgi:hypothetical protein
MFASHPPTSPPSPTASNEDGELPPTIRGTHIYSNSRLSVRIFLPIVVAYQPYVHPPNVASRGTRFQDLHGFKIISSGRFKPPESFTVAYLLELTATELLSGSQPLLAVLPTFSCCTRGSDLSKSYLSRRCRGRQDVHVHNVTLQERLVTSIVAGSGGRRQPIQCRARGS